MNKLTEFSNEKIFSRLLKNKSRENYWKYISELRKRKTKYIFDNAKKLTKSEIPKEQIIGINILAQFGYPRLHLKEILNTFFGLLQSATDKNVISSLLYGIGHNNEKLSEKQIALICTFQNHKSANVRHGIVSSLLGIEKTEAVITLIKLSKDTDSDVRDWATFGLGSQIELDNELIREVLWNRIEDKDEGTRDEAIFGLAKRKDKRIKEILKTELENLDEFGSLILQSIEEYNDKDFINLIEKQLIKNKEQKKVNEEWLENTLKKLKETD